MSEVNFGFNAVSLPGMHCFVSYSRSDKERVAGVALALYQMGLPIWYDNGLIPGTIWQEEILNHVKTSRVTIFFLTKQLFLREDTYMIDEFQFAKDFKKPYICVWLDDISKIDQNKMTNRLYLWWKELLDLHSINVHRFLTDSQKAMEIQRELAKVNVIDGSKLWTPKKATLIDWLTPKQMLIALAVVGLIGWQLAITMLPKIIDTGSGSKGSSEGTSVSSVVSDVVSTEDPSVVSDVVSTEDPSVFEPLSVGQHIYFGTYEQDNNFSNGGEPIEWRVLDVESDRALLLSEKLLDYQLYHTDYVAVTWEDCSLRQWLNGTFYQEAFSSGDRAKIALTNLSNPDSPRYGTKGGSNTMDHVFVLSVDEINEYFNTKPSMIAYTTNYSHKYGFDDTDHSGRWWLRTPGKWHGLTMRIFGTGGINGFGNRVDDETVGVRPAMWVNQ